jgi:hypothetical protein
VSKQVEKTPTGRKPSEAGESAPTNVMQIESQAIPLGQHLKSFGPLLGQREELFVRADDATRRVRF